MSREKQGIPPSVKRRHADSSAHRQKGRSNNSENQHPKIAPFLWFNDQAEEAVSYYTSIFYNLRRSYRSYNNQTPGMTHKS
jgi:hypothetical protein